MIPGPDKIIACPHCGFLAKQHTLLSGNTFGATLWSDGKRIAPMLPEFPAITKCGRCKKFYWVEDAKVKGEIQPFGDKAKRIPEEWERAEPVRDLGPGEYLDAIQAGLGNDLQKERYLRVHCWWSSNDLVRQQGQLLAPTQYPQNAIQNFVRLLKLLDANNPNDKIMMAEIHREMGNFDDAIRTLQDVPNEYRWVSDAIAQLAKKQDRVVRQLQPQGANQRKNTA